MVLFLWVAGVNAEWVTGPGKCDGYVLGCVFAVEIGVAVGQIGVSGEIRCRECKGVAIAQGGEVLRKEKDSGRVEIHLLRVAQIN